MRSLLPLALLLPASALAQDDVTEVLWYYGQSGSNVGVQTFSNYIDTDLNGNVTVTDNWSTVGDLADYRFVILARPGENYPQAQIDALNAYLDEKGILVIIGDSEANHGAAGIAALNDLTTRLDISVTFSDTHNFQNPEDSMNPDADCTVGNGSVQNTSPFLAVGTPIAVENSGDMTVTAPAQTLQTVGYNIADVGTDSARVIARQGLVLLTADYDMFSANPCAQASKEAMWRRIWDLYCDRDQDGFQPAICGGFDCDDTDEAIGTSFEWRDDDGDGFGDFAAPAPCEPGAVDNSEDCDDDNDQVNPDATEVCDGIDNDCDLDIDTDAAEATSWYTDFDGDGYGRDSDTIESCDQPDGRVDNNEDCDDGDDEAFPGAQERCGNNQDDDCDGDVDEGCATVQPTGGGGGTDPKKCGCSTATGLLGGLPLLFVAAGVTRRREHR